MPLPDNGQLSPTQDAHRVTIRTLSAGPFDRVECAMAAAQQKEIPQHTRKVVYEIINEHLRFLAFDACVSVGLKPAEEVRRLGQLRALTTAELSKEIPDFDRLDEAIAPAIQTFVTGSGPDQFEALQSLPDLRPG